MKLSYLNKTIAKFLLPLSCLFISAYSCNNNVDPTPKPETEPTDTVETPVVYDVYLCIGQSNMSGRGKMEPGDEAPLDNVWILDDNDSIIPAKAPLNIYSTVRKKASLQAINPSWSFAKKMATVSERPILLVVNARSGSPLSQWLKGCTKEYLYSEKAPDDPEKWGQPIPSLYDEAVRRTRKALQHGELKAVLWHQGEANSGEHNSSIYLDYLSGFVADLRKDLEAPKVPFVAGEIYYNDNAVYFNPMIRTIGERIENAYWVSAEGCGSNGDEHFSRQGQLLLGERYAEKVIEALGEK